MSNRSKHYQYPDVSIEQYSRSVRINFGVELLGRLPIYLDTKFWIMLRDKSNHAANHDIHRLWGLLKTLVADGRVFCPISLATFDELMKQQSASSRKNTAHLIDQLSLGASLINQKRLIETEIAYFIHQYGTKSDLYELSEIVWTKVTYVLGELHPVKTVFDSDTELVVQKMFFDHMWGLTLNQYLEQIQDEEYPHRDYSITTRQLNEGINAHKDSIKSFRQAYISEVHGIVDITASVCPDIVHDLGKKRGVIKDDLSEGDRYDSEKAWKNILASSLLKKRSQRTLRTIHILACLHASLRWNKGQKYKVNDLLDFNHAAAAIGYCKAFFTENSLASMVTQNHIALDKEYGCFVTSKIKGAIGYLETI